MSARGLTPELLLSAYARGIFPMADSRHSSEIYWIDPRLRGILPLGRFRVSRSLRRTIRSGRFAISFDADFRGVLDGCADRTETWINPEIARLYMALHATGHARSIEVREGDALVGGVYGVTLGAAFFGESMFSRRTDASKVALTYLVDRLRMSGFRLFDTQFQTSHLASLGGVEISRADYHAALDRAIATPARFDTAAPDPPDQVLQRMTQMS